MGSISITVANELFAATSYTYLEKNPIESMRNVATFVANDAMTKGKDVITGGHKIVVPWNFEEHSLPTQITFSAPYRQFDTFNQPQLTAGNDDWGALVQPVFWSGLDANHYGGPKAMVNVMETRVRTTREHFLRSLDVALVMGAATSGSQVAGVAVQAFSLLNTLNGVDFSTGFLEEASAGNNTIHGISRSTYSSTTYPKFHPIVLDFQNAAGVYLIDQIQRAKLTARRRGVDFKSMSLYGSDDFIINAGKVLRAPMQYASLKDGDGLSELPVIMGREVLPVTLPYQGATSANYKVSLLGIPWGKDKGVRLMLQKGWALDFSKFAEIPGTAECSAALYKFEGQLIMDNPGACMIGVRGDTY